MSIDLSRGPRFSDIAVAFFGAGAAGCVGVTIAFATAPISAQFLPWLVFAGAISLIMALVGLYGFAAPYVGFPLPQPHEKHKRGWRLGLLSVLIIILSFAGIAALLSRAASSEMPPAGPQSPITKPRLSLVVRMIKEVSHKNSSVSLFNNEPIKFYNVPTAFKADRRFPIAGKNYTAVDFTLTNIGNVGVTYIWIDFSVTYLLDESTSSTPAVPDLVASALNPMTATNLHPNVPMSVSAPAQYRLSYNAPGLDMSNTKLSGLAINLRPIDPPIVFRMTNATGSFIYFSPLPTSAEVETVDGKYVLADIESSSNSGDSMLLPPSR